MLSLAPNYPKFRVLVSYSSTQALITIPMKEIYHLSVSTSNPKSSMSNYSDIAKQDIVNI